MCRSSFVALARGNGGIVSVVTGGTSNAMCRSSISRKTTSSRLRRETANLEQRLKREQAALETLI